MKSPERLRREALEYDAKHPQIWKIFERFALQAVTSGRRRFSVSMIIERMRWFTTVEAKGEPFKISNTMRAYYGRKFLWKHKHLKTDFFTMRPSAFDGMFDGNEQQSLGF